MYPSFSWLIKWLEWKSNWLVSWNFQKPRDKLWNHPLKNERQISPEGVLSCLQDISLICSVNTTNQQIFFSTFEPSYLAPLGSWGSDNSMHCKDNFACVCVCDWAWFMLSIIHNAHRSSTLLFGQDVGHKITSRRWVFESCSQLCFAFPGKNRWC